MNGRACVIAAALLVPAAHAAHAQPASISTLLVRDYRFPVADLVRLREGEPVARLVATSVSSEVIVIGAIRIDVPPDVMAARIRDIERFETGKGFLATSALSEPPRLEDFRALQFPRDDLVALRACRPGRCAVKIGQDTFERLAPIDWRATDALGRANDLLRSMALGYVTSYRDGGNRKLPTYVDKPVPMQAAGEFSALLAHARPLLDRAPGLAGYLESGPPQRLAGAGDVYYWSLAEFGLKPLFRVNHLVIAPASGSDGTRFVAAIKQLYASHYFHTALEVRIVADDPERPGAAHYLVDMSLARADGFTGLFGPLIRARVRSASLDGILRSLRATKRRIELAGPGPLPDGK